MTLESLYFIAQIIAALAIVGSLVFVGQQIKAQIHEQRLQRINERAALVAGITNHMLQIPGLRAIMENDSKYQDLSRGDQLLYSGWARQFMQMQTVVFAHATEGHGIDPSLYGHRSVSARAAATILFKSWWIEFGGDYAPEVRAYVEGLVPATTAPQVPR